MKKLYFPGSWLARGRKLGTIALLAAAAPAAHAQNTPPAWQTALGTSQQTSGSFTANATAADASGNVYVAGSFNGQVIVGGTTLVSAGGADIFVAKWSATTGNFTWVQRGGGTGFDGASAIALSGTSIYVGGFFNNSTTNASAVTFGTLALNGLAATAGNDAFVAKLTDAGTAGTFVWAQAAGGTSSDGVTALAVSGSSVFAAGYFNNNAANANAVTFGTATLNGATATASTDVFVAKLTDAGSTGAFTWAQGAGGTGTDQPTAIAVSGSSIYAAGYYNNTAANVSTVTFGTTTLNGFGNTAGNDAFLTKLTDAGSTGSFVWTQAAGGSGTDQISALAVSGTSVYAGGYFTNTSANANAVTFGSTTLNGQSATASTDAFVAKLTDAGTTGAFTWAQAAGGAGLDQVNGLAVNGSSVYATGYFTNDATNTNAVTFGPTTVNGVSPLLTNDIFVSKLADAGSAGTFAWTQTGGGNSLDTGVGLAQNAAGIFVVGAFSTSATFGTAAGSPLNSGIVSGDSYVAQLTETSTSATWTRVGAAEVGGIYQGRATATDATGNVYIAGYFTGKLTLGSTTLLAAGNTDLLVAKWNPTTSAWLWAVAAGGIGADQLNAIVVSGNSLYVAGSITNSSTNASQVLIGGTLLNGTSTTNGRDILVAKLTDAGTSATWTWAQAAGGINTDQANALAVSGTSLYTTGYFSNNTFNGSTVTFGAAPLNGLGTSALGNDIFVAKLTDAGSTGSFVWAQAAGGTSTDQANAIAVNGTSIYTAGVFANNTTNANTVTFGTATLNGLAATAGSDVFVAKLTDAGTTGTFAWAQAAGGTSTDQANALAVNGANVYAAGYFTNTTANANTVTFGTATLNGLSTTAGNDLFVAKLTDAGTSGTFVWAQAAGGTGTDQALGLAVNNSIVYATGYFTNSSANANAVTFGAAGTVNGATATASQDIFVTKLTDAGTTGTFNWAQVAGSTGADQGLGLAVSGNKLYTTGQLLGTATFGPATVTNTYNNFFSFGAAITDTTTPLATTSASRHLAFTIYPNPARQLATVAGLPAGSTLTLSDLLGRCIIIATADATGTADLPLPAGLRVGVYVVQSGNQASRLVVE